MPSPYQQLSIFNQRFNEDMRRSHGNNMSMPQLSTYLQTQYGIPVSYNNNHQRYLKLKEQNYFFTLPDEFYSAITKQVMDTPVYRRGHLNKGHIDRNEVPDISQCNDIEVDSTLMERIDTVLRQAEEQAEAQMQVHRSTSRSL